MRRLITTAGAICAGVVLLGWLHGSRGQTTKPAKPDKLVARLDELAAIGSVMVDGDECLQIVTDRAAELMFRVDPRDRWAGSDNYDVNFEPFIRTKKLLIRLGRLADFPVDCNLWMICKKRPKMVHMVIRQLNGWSQWYRFGQLAIDPPAEMKRVLSTGQRVTVEGKLGDRVSVLSPVRNSLGDVVGLLEICTRRSAVAVRARG